MKLFIQYYHNLRVKKHAHINIEVQRKHTWRDSTKILKKKKKKKKKIKKWQKKKTSKKKKKKKKQYGNVGMSFLYFLNFIQWLYAANILIRCYKNKLKDQLPFTNLELVCEYIHEHILFNLLSSWIGL